MAGFVGLVVSLFLVLILVLVVLWLVWVCVVRLGFWLVRYLFVCLLIGFDWLGGLVDSDCLFDFALMVCFSSLRWCIISFTGLSLWVWFGLLLDCFDCLF